jgi:hypothetical protein
MSLSQKQICKYAKEHLGTFFSDGVFCNFFDFFWRPNNWNTQIGKYADGFSRLICLLNNFNLK